MSVLSNPAARALTSALIVCGTVSTCYAGEFGASRVNGGHRCAAYGSDYVAVEGGDTCVRIGGRMRVPVAPVAGVPSDGAWSMGRASAAALRSETPSAQTRHLRVSGVGYPDPFH